MVRGTASGHPPDTSPRDTIRAVQGGPSESLVDLDVRAARSRRRSAERRARLRRPKLRHKLRRPVLAVVAIAAVALGVVSGPRGLAEAQRLTRPSHHVSAAPACPLPAGLRSAFESAAAKTGLPMALLVAVGSVESQLDQSATSSAGAVGVLQLMPETAAALRADPTEAAANVLAGARYLKLLLNRYHSTDLALAAYNAGPTAVDVAGGAPTTQTLTYVANVQARWRALSGCG
jgi:soluble lytic murein transglycosylase-like protein